MHAGESPERGRGTAPTKLRYMAGAEGKHRRTSGSGRQVPNVWSKWVSATISAGNWNAGEISTPGHQHTHLARADLHIFLCTYVLQCGLFKLKLENLAGTT